MKDDYNDIQKIEWYYPGNSKLYNNDASKVITTGDLLQFERLKYEHFNRDLNFILDTVGKSESSYSSKKVASFDGLKLIKITNSYSYKNYEYKIYIDSVLIYSYEVLYNNGHCNTNHITAKWITDVAPTECINRVCQVIYNKVLKIKEDKRIENEKRIEKENADKKLKRAVVTNWCKHAKPSVVDDGSIESVYNKSNDNSSSKSLDKSIISGWFRWLQP